MMGGSPYRAVRRAVRRGAGRVWHDLRAGDLYRSGKEFDLMPRAMGFAALALLTVIPLLLVVAAVSPAPHRGLAVWVVDGMGLTGSSAGAVTQIFTAPTRVLGTTSVFSAVLLGVFGISFAGSVQAGFERIWGCPVGPWHKIWRQAVWLAVLLAYIFAEATVGAVTNGGLAATLSWVPPFSPILMPYQQATGQAGPGLVTLAVVLMLAATALFTAIGGRIYARSVLRSGSRVRLTEALRG